MDLEAAQADLVDQLKLICAAPVETIPPCPEEEAKAHAAILQINKSLDDARKKITDLQQDLNRQTADAKGKSDKQIATVNESFKAQLEKVKTELRKIWHRMKRIWMRR